MDGYFVRTSLPNFFDAALSKRCAKQQIRILLYELMVTHETLRRARTLSRNHAAGHADPGAGDRALLSVMAADMRYISLRARLKGW